MLCTVRPKCQVRAQSQTYLTINGHFRLGSCVDGSLLARNVLRFVQIGRVQSCVRPVDAVLMTAGPNAIRGIGSQSTARA